MKVKDFIDLIRPLTACDPDSDIFFSFFMNDFAIHCKKGDFECSIRSINVPLTQDNNG